jgi:leucine dehydrogenase
MSVFESTEFGEHDQVVFCRDRAAGLYAIIAIHDRTLGPAVGGCRMRPYDSEAEAIRDVLRLSRGMTYKNAMAGLPLGGGKSVILGDPRRDKSEALLRAFGRFVEGLSGRYIAAEDVGFSVDDIEVVGRETRHVAGLESGLAASGDPSPFTAYGVLVGMRVAVEHRLARKSLEGVRIAVQGLGHVGSHLCRLLHQEGASLVVADIDEAKTRTVAAECDARSVPVADIHAQDVDVFAPCALGAVLDDATIPQLRAAVVAGAANNQLAEPAHAAMLAGRGILYAPDYVINAGGIINICGELAGDYDRNRIRERVAGIHDTLMRVFRAADEEGRDTAAVADALARAVLEEARAKTRRGGRALSQVARFDAPSCVPFASNREVSM